MDKLEVINNELARLHLLYQLLAGVDPTDCDCGCDEEYEDDEENENETGTEDPSSDVPDEETKEDEENEEDDYEYEEYTYVTDDTNDDFRKQQMTLVFSAITNLHGVLDRAESC